MDRVVCAAYVQRHMSADHVQVALTGEGFPSSNIQGHLHPETGVGVGQLTDVALVGRHHDVLIDEGRQEEDLVGGGGWLGAGCGLQGTRTRV